jgi:hypothetical protein
VTVDGDDSDAVTVRVKKRREPIQRLLARHAPHRLMIGPRTSLGRYSPMVVSVRVTRRTTRSAASSIAGMTWHVGADLVPRHTRVESDTAADLDGATDQLRKPPKPKYRWPFLADRHSERLGSAEGLADGFFTHPILGIALAAIGVVLSVAAKVRRRSAG